MVRYCGRFLFDKRVLSGVETNSSSVVEKDLLYLKSHRLIIPIIFQHGLGKIERFLGDGRPRVLLDPVYHCEHVSDDDGPGFVCAEVVAQTARGHPVQHTVLHKRRTKVTLEK